jgi:hypothetical protein
LDNGKEAVTGVAGPREVPITTNDDPWAMVELKSAALPASSTIGRNDWAVAHGGADRAEHRNPSITPLFTRLLGIWPHIIVVFFGQAAGGMK